MQSRTAGPRKKCSRPKLSKILSLKKANHTPPHQAKWLVSATEEAELAIVGGCHQLRVNRVEAHVPNHVMNALAQLVEDSAHANIVQIDNLGVDLIFLNRQKNSVKNSQTV